jgi:hypothetical protein
MNQIEQVILLGAPRSGTTFLASLLENTRFGPPFETHFIPKYFKRLSDYGDLQDRDNFSALIKDISSERPVMQWKLDLNTDALYEELNGDISYANIVNLLCLKASQVKGYSSWGEKTPWYLSELDTLTTLFPSARFLYIVRDGRDVALSLLEKDWGPNNIYSCAHYWKNLNKKSEIIESLKAKGQLIELRYEDLLADPERYVKLIYAHLGEKYDVDAMSSILSATRSDNSGKWRKRMTPSQVRLFEQIASSTLIRFGYDVTFDEKPLNHVTSLLYRIHNKSIWLKFMFMTNVVDEFKIRFLGKEPFAD